MACRVHDGSERGGWAGCAFFCGEFLAMILGGAVIFSIFKVENFIIFNFKS